MEIGKRGIWERRHRWPPSARRRLPRALSRRSLRARAGADPGDARPRWRRSSPPGGCAPLPHRVYPAARAADAFRFMAQARHVGKIVVTPPASAPARAHPRRRDATWSPAGWARSACAPRSGCTRAAPATSRSWADRPPSPAAARAVGPARAGRGRGRVIRGDVARAEDVRAAPRPRSPRALPPLRGVVHAAGVLDDAVLAGQSRAVARPPCWRRRSPARGTCTRDARRCRSTSSSSSRRSPPCSARRARRTTPRPTPSSTRWPPSGAPQGRRGLADELGPVERGRHGGEPRRARPAPLGQPRACAALAAAEALDGLERALAGRRGAHVTAARHRLGPLRAPSSRRAPAARSAGSARRTATRARRRRAARPALLAASRRAARPRGGAAVLAHVREQVIRVLQLPPEPDARPGAGAQGPRARLADGRRAAQPLQVSTGRALPTTLAFDHPTVAAIARFLGHEVLGLESAESDRPRTPDDDGRLADEVRGPVRRRGAPASPGGARARTRCASAR